MAGSKLIRRPGSVVGTIWQGLDQDERPDQDRSPWPYLTLREMLALPLYCPSFTSLVAASRTAHSDAGASTERLPATVAKQKPTEKSTGFDLGFSDLRRCGTADQSGVPVFGDFSDGN